MTWMLLTPQFPTAGRQSDPYAMGDAQHKSVQGTRRYGFFANAHQSRNCVTRWFDYGL
jgi:hypothetical protein